MVFVGDSLNVVKGSVNGIRVVCDSVALRAPDSHIDHCRRLHRAAKTEGDKRKNGKRPYVAEAAQER